MVNIYHLTSLEHIETFCPELLSFPSPKFIFINNYNNKKGKFLLYSLKLFAWTVWYQLYKILVLVLDLLNSSIFFFLFLIKKMTLKMVFKIKVKIIKIKLTDIYII